MTADLTDFLLPILTVKTTVLMPSIIALQTPSATARTEIETRLEPPRNPPVAAFPDWRVSVLRLAGFGSCTGGY